MAVFDPLALQPVVRNVPVRQNVRLAQRLLHGAWHRRIDGGDFRRGEGADFGSLHQTPEVGRPARQTPLQRTQVVNNSHS